MKTLSEQVRKLEVRLEGLQLQINSRDKRIKELLKETQYYKNELMFDIMDHKGALIVVEDLEALLGMINRHTGHILKVKIHTTEEK